MNRLVFAEDINRIYERVTLINESLSVYESREFIRGFKDGIKEGALLFEADWFNKAAGWAGKQVGAAEKGIRDTATAVKKTVSGAYQQGKELAQKAWNSVKEFAQHIYNKVVKGFTDAVKWIESEPGKIADYISVVYNDLVKDITSAYNTLKDKGQDFLTSLTTFWNGTIVKTVNDSVAKVKQWFIDNSNKVNEWYNKNKTIIQSKIDNFKKSSIDKIKQFAQYAEKILTDIGSGVLSVAKGVGILAAFLVITPIHFLILGIKKVPDLYNSMQTVVENGLNEIEKSWKEGAAAFSAERTKAATGMSTRQINFGKDSNNQLFRKYKNPAYVKYKDQIAAALNKRGVSLATERHIETFEGFKSLNKINKKL